MSALPEVLTRLWLAVAPGGMVFRTRGLGGCARAHPPGVAPEALEEWIYSSRGFFPVEWGVLLRLLSPRVRVRVAGPRLGRRKSPRASARSKRAVRSFPVFFAQPSRILFSRKEGWSMPGYPRWASSDTSGELLTGKSKWRPMPHSIGVAWWSRDAL